MLFATTDLVQILLVTLGCHIVPVYESQRRRVDTVTQAAAIRGAIVKDVAQMTIAVHRAHFDAGHAVSRISRQSSRR
jgi:hypothetical protein